MDDTSSTWEFHIPRIQDCVHMAGVDRHSGICCKSSVEGCAEIREYTVEENCSENNAYTYNEIIKNERSFTAIFEFLRHLESCPIQREQSP